MIASARERLRHHLAFWLLLGVGLAIRVVTMVAYPPALFFSDSWGYVSTAFTGHPISFSYLRPNGYAALLKLLTIPGRDLVQLVAIQHLSGLVLAGLVYVALLRARVPRVLALAGAALILLDGYRITLEQYVMPDTLFTLTIVCAALLLAWTRLSAQVPLRSSRLSAGRAGLAGLLLAAAILQREAGLFAAPAFVAYLLLTRTHPRALLAFILAVALPLLAFAALYQARLGVFGLSESGGWTLYGRVAAFADCATDAIPRSELALCETSRERASHPAAPTWYIWDARSPALRMFPGAHDYRQSQELANRVLDNFARRVVLHQSLQYLDASFSDVLRYFTPGATAFDDSISATSLPPSTAKEDYNRKLSARALPHVRGRVQAPAGLVSAYRRILHVPRPWLAALAIVSLLALVLPRRGSYRPTARGEVLLLSGSGLLLIVGTAASAGFSLRYLLPAVPLLALGGSLAIRDLIPVARSVPHPHLRLRLADRAGATRSLPR